MVSPRGKKSSISPDPNDDGIARADTGGHVSSESTRSNAGRNARRMIGADNEVCDVSRIAGVGSGTIVASVGLSTCFTLCIIEDANEVGMFKTACAAGDKLDLASFRTMRFIHVKREDTDQTHCPMAYEVWRQFEDYKARAQLQLHHMGQRLTGSLNGLFVPYGGVSIVARGGAGKTPLGYAFSDCLSAVHVTFGEAVPWSENRLTKLNEIILSCLVSGTSLVVDSFKDLLFTGEGGTGKGGISKLLFRDFSNLCTMFAQRYCTLVALVNINNPSDEAQKDAYETLNSNFNMALVGDGGRWNFKLRDYVHSTRSEGSIVFNARSPGTYEVKHDSVALAGTTSNVGLQLAGLSEDDLSDRTGTGAPVERSAYPSVPQGSDQMVNLINAFTRGTSDNQTSH